MSTIEHRHAAHRGGGAALVMILAFVGLAGGFFGSSFATAAVWFGGPVLLIVGGIGMALRARWGAPVSALAAGAVLGAAVWIGLGMLPFGSPSSLSGGVAVAGMP